MNLFAFGLNHRTAPVAMREKTAFSSEQLPEAVRSLASEVDVSEAAILSTCNRTEIYCGHDGLGPEQIIDWLCSYGQLSPRDLTPSTYCLPGEKAVKHAFRVASGLDSMVLGEPQILGQMKSAFTAAHRAGTTARFSTACSSIRFLWPSRCAAKLQSA